MRKLSPLLFIVLFLTSCQGVWKQGNKDAFFEACMDDAKTWEPDSNKAKTYCECVTTKVLQSNPDINNAMDNIESLSRDPEIQKCKALIQK